MTGRRDPRDDASDFVAGSRSKSALIRRLRRIEGQARGLQKMVEEERDAADILMQIASVREALHSAAALILQAHLAANAEAILLAENAGENERLVARTLDVFKKWAT